MQEEHSSYSPDDFYSDIVVFEVEKTHFRTFKRALLRPGSFFETLFTLPVGQHTTASSTQTPEGSSDENPIRLYDIKKVDFGSFLRVLCPYEGIPPCSTYDEWIGVLRLATMWDFPQVRQQAITWLTPYIGRLSSTSQIVAAKEYEVKQWLINAYAKIVIQSGPLRKQDLVDGGITWDTMASLYSVRDQWLQSKLAAVKREPFFGKCSRCSEPSGIKVAVYFQLKEELAQKMVAKEFALELATMRAD